MDQREDFIAVEPTAEVTPEEPPSGRGSLWVLVGGAALVAALLFGAYVATGDDVNELDVAAQGQEQDRADADQDADEDTADTIDADPADEPAPPDADLPANDSDDVVELVIDGGGDARSDFGEAADSAFFEGGGGGVIFDGSQFISIGYGESGQTLRTSPDGVTWVEKPFPGFPPNSNVFQLDHYDGTVVAVVEQWPFSDESGDVVEDFFGPVEGPTQYLASSTDLETWDLVELPASDLTDDERVYTNVSGLAIGEPGVVILTQQTTAGPNEMRILFDAGILDADNLQSYCGIEYGDGDTYLVQLCDFGDQEQLWQEFEQAMEGADTDEERAAIERRFDEAFVEPTPTVIATISPGDPTHERIAEVFSRDWNEPETVALTGPVTGPFTSSTLAQQGYPSGIVEVDGTFVAVMQRWDDESAGGASATAVRSVDGLNWQEAGSLPDGNSWQLLSSGSTIVSLGGDRQGQPRSFASTDLGASWASTGLSTELLNSFPQGADGPAGIAVMIQGVTEPYPEFLPPGAITISREGYTLTMSFSEDGSQTTLTGPDGKEIYSLRDEELYGEQSDSIVRFGRMSGSQTFLDPETGEDLVSFTSQDFEDAYSEPDFGPQQSDQASELWFTRDGTSWTLLDDPQLDIEDDTGNVQLLAVGDDEVIVAKYIWVEPPPELYAFEEEGRNPTPVEEVALEFWFTSNGGEDAIEYIRIDVG